MKTGKIISVPVTDLKEVKDGNNYFYIYGFLIVTIKHKIPPTAEFIDVEELQHCVGLNEIFTLAVEHVNHNTARNKSSEYQTLPLAPDQWQQAIDNGLVDSGRQVYFEEFTYEPDIYKEGSVPVVRAKIVTTGWGELMEFPTPEKKATRFESRNISLDTREEFQKEWSIHLKDANFLPLITEPAQKLYSEEDIKEMIDIIFRFRNHANVYGYPSRSFKEKVNKFWNDNK